MGTAKKTFSIDCSVAQAAGSLDITAGHSSVVDISTIPFEVYTHATATSNVGFVKNATGIEIPGDPLVNEGASMYPGLTSSASPFAFTIGDVPAFEFEVQFKIPTTNDWDVSFVGFKKADQVYTFPNNVNIATASQEWGGTDYAAMAAPQGDVRSYTRLNSGATTDTDLSVSNWLDGESHSFKVLVSATGEVTYEFDGAAPSGAAAFTFDVGDTLVPGMAFNRLNQSNASQVELQLVAVRFT